MKGKAEMAGIFSHLPEAVSTVSNVRSLQGSGFPTVLKPPFSFLLTRQSAERCYTRAIYSSMRGCLGLESLEAPQSGLGKFRSMFSQLCTSILISQIRNRLVWANKCEKRLE